MKFVHKDKEFFDAVCKVFPSFKKRFQEACEEQWGDALTTVVVRRGCGAGFYWRIVIPKADIKIIEELKPYVWYKREKFDGNPNNYDLIERNYDYSLILGYPGKSNRSGVLNLNTEWFMYIEPLKE